MKVTLDKKYEAYVHIVRDYVDRFIAISPDDLEFIKTYEFELGDDIAVEGCKDKCFEAVLCRGIKILIMIETHQ